MGVHSMPWYVPKYMYCLHRPIFQVYYLSKMWRTTIQSNTGQKGMTATTSISDTIPSGPQLQALWRSPRKMHHWSQETKRILEELERNGNCIEEGVSELGERWQAAGQLGSLGKLTHQFCPLRPCSGPISGVRISVIAVNHNGWTAFKNKIVWLLW